jgi:hypothetical protein
VKKTYWNVLVEIYQDGTVKAAVIRNREAKNQPKPIYRNEPGREVFSLWYGSEEEAQGAVLEAKAMNAKRRRAAA